MPPLPSDEKDMARIAEQTRRSFSENDFRHRLRLSDLTRLSMRTFTSRSLRSFLTTLGIAVGIAAVLFLVSLGFGLREILLEQIAKTEDSLFSIEAYFPSESSLVMTESDLWEIRRIDGVAEVSPVAEYQGEIRSGLMNGLVRTLLIDGSYFRLSGNIPEVGDGFLEGETAKVVFSSAALRFFSLTPEEAIGERIRLSVRTPEVREVPRELTIVGVIDDDVSEPYVLAARAILPDLFPTYQSVLVRAETLDFVFVIRDILLDRGTFISAKLDLINQANKILNIATIILGVFGVTALIVSAIGMFNTMTIALLERTYEIGIMKSLGATDKDIKKLFLTEAFLMGLFGGIAGLLIGIGGSVVMNAGLNILAANLGGKPVDLFVRPYWFMASLVIFSALVSLITGYWPARRSVKLSPIEAFKKQ